MLNKPNISHAIPKIKWIFTDLFLNHIFIFKVLHYLVYESYKTYTTNIVKGNWTLWKSVAPMFRSFEYAQNPSTGQFACMTCRAGTTLLDSLVSIPIPIPIAIGTIGTIRIDVIVTHYLFLFNGIEIPKAADPANCSTLGWK